MGTHNADQLVVWQWNCRGFRRKRGPLQQYIAMTSMSLDVTLLQEPNCTPSFSGLEAYGSDSGLIGTLVSNRLTVRIHSVASDIPHQIIEVIMHTKHSDSLFILSLYRSRRARTHNFHYLFTEFTKLGNKLLISRDFNTPHSVWGYPKSTVKGTKLWDNICNMRFTLLTDPAQPTRIGNSVSRDTCSNLTMARGTGVVYLVGP